MRILIYGAGVIGCLYATLFSEAGYDTTIYARGKRLDQFREKGLLYFKKKEVKKANVTISDKVEKEDVYDFVFLTVKENQVYNALKELGNNDSPNIVTMVNTLESYSDWEKLCGKGRIIPAFPGAGGSFEEDVLHAALTPWLVQPTTFGEINGKESKRLSELATLFKRSHIPYQIVKNMHEWQLCHLAMVVPIADAYYEAEHPEKSGILLSPTKMNLFRLLPTAVLNIALSFVFRSNFGNVFMYRHSMNAPDEMKQLHQQFYHYLETGTK